MLGILSFPWRRVCHVACLVSNIAHENGLAQIGVLAAKHHTLKRAATIRDHPESFNTLASSQSFFLKSARSGDLANLTPRISDSLLNIAHFQTFSCESGC